MKLKNLSINIKIEYILLFFLFKIQLNILLK